MNLKFLFNKQNYIITILSIIYFICGVLFCVLPSAMMSSFETILCFLSLAYGGIMMFAYCFAPIVFQNKKIMLSAVVSIILGSLLLFVRSFFVLALAFLIAGFAVYKLIAVVKSRQTKNVIWWSLLALLIFYFIVSILVMVFFAISKFANVSMILIGVCLIFEAVFNIIFKVMMEKLKNIQMTSEIVLEDSEE